MLIGRKKGGECIGFLLFPPQRPPVCLHTDTIPEVARMFDSSAVPPSPAAAPHYVTRMHKGGKERRFPFSNFFDSACFFAALRREDRRSKRRQRIFKEKEVKFPQFSPFFPLPEEGRRRNGKGKRSHTSSPRNHTCVTEARSERKNFPHTFVHFCECASHKGPCQS